MKNIFYDRPNPVPPLAEQAQKLQKALDAFAVPVTCVVAQPAERPHIAFVLNDNDDPILNVELSSDAHTLHEIADEAEDHAVNYPGMDANNEVVNYESTYL